MKVPGDLGFADRVGWLRESVATPVRSPCCGLVGPAIPVRTFWLGGQRSDAL